MDHEKSESDLTEDEIEITINEKDKNKNLNIIHQKIKFIQFEDLPERIKEFHDKNSHI